MAKLIIEGELLQLLKIQKAQRLLEARKIVKCTIEENKEQESESSPVFKDLPPKIDIQIDEEIEAKEESVTIKDVDKAKEIQKVKVNIQKSKGRPKVKK